MDAGKRARSKAWLAGGSESAPRSVNDVDDDGWPLLLWVARPGASRDHRFTEDHVEIARYLLSRGARLDVVSRWSGSTTLHFACGTLGASPDFVSVLVSAGAEVNARADDGATPLARMMWEFPARASHVKVLEIMLRAGASLDSVQYNQPFDALLQSNRGSRNEHFVAMREIVASVRRHGSWKAHCIAPHRMVLRLRSLVARGRAKLPRARRRSQASASSQALYFLVRQGDNGIVWNILSYWRATK